jgi:hypothetical protein
LSEAIAGKSCLAPAGTKRPARPVGWRDKKKGRKNKKPGATEAPGLK